MHKAGDNSWNETAKFSKDRGCSLITSDFFLTTACDPPVETLVRIFFQLQAVGRKVPVRVQ